MNVKALDPESLESKLKSLLETERGAQVAFLLHLGEFDRRKQYRRHNYGNVWQYCLGVLRLSKTQTFYRVAAARMLTRFPMAADYLADGRICITSFVLLRKVLDEQNMKRILDDVVGKKKEDVERIVVSIRPIAAP